jgi:hypothetical protein
MAEMTDADWADAVATQAASDGLDAGPIPGSPSHYRVAKTIRDKDGNVVLQCVIDVRENGFTGETDGSDNTL